MTKINYDGRVFRSVANSESGEVGGDTVFEYRHDGDIAWAEYSGGSIRKGQLIATCDAEGVLDMRYAHVNIAGELKTGICRSVPELMNDGRIRLHETWQWTCGDGQFGESIVEELPNLG